MNAETHFLSTKIEDYSLVRFMPLSVNKESLLDDILLATDLSLDYGADEDVKDRDFEEPDD